MPMNADDIMKGLAAFASSGTLDQGKRYLMTEAAGLIKFQQHRVMEAERKQQEALQQMGEVKAINDALKMRMSGMLATQIFFRKQLSEMITMKFPAEGEAFPDDHGQ